MAVKVLCPNPTCGAAHSLEPEDLGKGVRCHTCGWPLDADADTPQDRRPGIETVPVPGAPEVRPGSPAIQLPNPFGRYKILTTLGEGGMGAVFLAHDTKLDRKVALKIPYPDLIRSPEGLGRFLREARLAARFRHPNFCPIDDVGEIDGIYYLAMAFIEGRPLSAMLKQGQPLEPRRAVDIALRLARVLAEAHSQGVIHRDLKPANVMVDPRGELILMDFGIARRLDVDATEYTRTGEILGTPFYMAPELVQGDKERVGPGTDVYGLGVILYELLTGHRPFEGSAPTVLAAILTREPPPPSRLRPGLAAELEAICLKAMAKRIEDRYDSMIALAAALETYLSGAQRLKPPPWGCRREIKLWIIINIIFYIIMAVIVGIASLFERAP